jgi:hypothetical protein
MFNTKIRNAMYVVTSLALTEVESLPVSVMAWVSSNSEVQTGKLSFAVD